MQKVSNGRLLFCSVAVMALTGGGPAMAQNKAKEPEQPAASNPDIIVTGIRATLTSARGLKRNADQLVDSIVAQDIGKLPDTSIAGTLQRIPGVQIARDTRGQGNAYVVHGLKQVMTTVNGRQIFSTTNRSASLLDYSADILSGIDVYKTATADQIEGGLGGLINIHTARPFDFKGLHVAGTLSGFYSDVNDKLSPRASLVVSNRFDTGIGEIGILVGGQYERVFSGGYQVSTNAYTDNRNLYDRDGDGIFPNDPSGDAVTLPSQVRPRYETGDLTRSALYAAVQWKPSDTLTIHADATRLYTGSHSATRQLSIQTDGATGGTAFSFKSGPNQNIPNRYTLTNALVRSNTGASDFIQHTNMYAVGFDWQMDAFSLTGEGAYIESKAPFYSRSIAILSRAPQATIDLSGNTPDVQVTGVDLTSPAAFTGTPVYSDLGQQAFGKEPSFRIDGKYEFEGSPITALRIGARYARHRVTNDVYSIGQNVTLTQPLTAVTALTPGDLFTDRTVSTNQWLTIKPGILDSMAQTRALAGVSLNDPVYPLNNSYNYLENVWALYGRADFAFDIGVPIDGNIGLRYLSTGNRQRVYIASGSTFTPVNGSSHYDNWLPSVNVRAKLTPDLFLRLAFSKAISRPEFGNLSPAVLVNVLSQTGSGGNPNLAPTTADQYDASVEYYFGKSNYAAVSLFQKDVTGFAQKFAQEEVIDGTPYLITRPRNAGAGTIKGFEVFYQQFFDFLPGALRGLGFQGNYTYVESALPVIGTSLLVPGDLLSKHSFNLTGIYELGPLSVQLAYNWRSKSVQTNLADSAGRTLWNAPLESLDLSASYNLTENVSIKFDAVNLNGGYQRQYYGSPDIPTLSNQYDRSYQLGVRVNL